MKKISTFVLLFLSIFLFSQYISPEIKLVRNWETSKTFKGEIAGQPITLHLEYMNHSGWHDKVFSVKGWYYYDRFQKKIDLMGFYNGNFMLYHFNNAKDYDKISSEDLFCWTEPCPKFENYNEFLEIIQDDQKTQKGSMTKDGKKFKLKLKTDDLDITKRNEWLYLPNKKSYNLYDLLDAYGGNEIVSTYSDKKENRIMLSFERDSNFNKHGFCGATPPETGFRLLTFDKNWKIKKFQVYSTNSCLADVTFEEELKTKYDHIKAFYINFNDSRNLLIVNLKNSTFGTRFIRKNFSAFG